MYLKLTKGSSNWSYENDQIKELSFTPEYDPTLSTYPTCEYEAKIYDTQRNASDLLYSIAYLYGIEPSSSSDYNSLIAGYYKLTEAKEIGNHLIQIRAQSILAELDKVWMHGHFYNYENIESAVDAIFEAAGYIPNTGPYRIWSVMTGYEVYGYCPDQTARDRLIWCAQSIGASILQWGQYSGYGLCIAQAIDTLPDMSYVSYSTELMPYDNTYRKPNIKERKTPGKLKITRYGSWSDSKPSATGWESIIVGYSYDLDEYDRHPEYLYYFTYESTETNPNGGDETEASISGNILINSLALIENVARAYFRNMTAELEMLISTRDFRKYMPGQKVRFYADQTTMYAGVIRSAQFISGQLTRVKLVIDTDSTPVSLVHVRFNYVYAQGQDSRQLGHRDYYVVPGNYMTVDHPTFKSYVVDRWETFTPQTASTTIQPSQDTTTTINYSRS